METAIETVISATKKDFIEAMHRYNLESLNNPGGFEDIEDSKECAERQVDYLIKCLNEVRG